MAGGGERLPKYEVRVHSLEEGRWVLREGDENRTFFVVMSGYLRVLHHDKAVRILKEPDVFGLESLLLHSPSPYDVRTIAPCRISEYSREALDYFFTRNPRMAQMIVTSILQQLAQTTSNLVRQSEVFSPEDVEMRFFSDGEVIVAEETTGKEFFRLVSSAGGLVVSRKGVEMGRITEPDEFFGEMAGILNTPRQATITSVGESSVQVFSADKLELIINDYPQLVTRLIRTLAARLAQANRKLVKSDSDPDSQQL